MLLFPKEFTELGGGLSLPQVTARAAPPRASSFIPLEIASKFR